MSKIAFCFYFVLLGLQLQLIAKNISNVGINLHCDTMCWYEDSLKSIILDQRIAKLSPAGNYLLLSDRIICTNGLYNEPLFVAYDRLTGNRIAKAHFFTDSTIYECYKLVHGKRLKEAWAARLRFFGNSECVTSGEFDAGPLTEYGDGFRMAGSLGIINLDEGFDRPWQIVLEYDGDLDLKRFYLAQNWKDEKGCFFNLNFPESDFAINDSQFLALHFCLGKTQIEELQLLSIVSIRNNRLVETEVLTYSNSIFSKLNKSNNLGIQPSCIFTSNKEVYWVYSILPFAYSVETKKEYELPSNLKISFDSLINNYREVKDWPFVINLIQPYKKKFLYIYRNARSSSKSFICILDKNFKELRCKEISLIPEALKGQANYEILGIEKDKIQYLLFSNDEVLFRQLPLAKYLD